MGAGGSMRTLTQAFRECGVQTLRIAHGLDSLAETVSPSDHVFLRGEAGKERYLNFDYPAKPVVVGSLKRPKQVQMTPSIETELKRLSQIKADRPGILLLTSFNNYGMYSRA